MVMMDGQTMMKPQTNYWNQNFKMTQKNLQAKVDNGPINMTL